jgi:7,8-dihydropterin-6-yl-methyl-4-(beta-D-ribofuranosyl)aminobenzene 5'-phosphate synthase
MTVSFRINPLWWPVLAVSSPVIIPFLILKNRQFKAGKLLAEENNARRMKAARPIAIPALTSIELVVLSEWFHEEGCLGEAGVSYLFRTDRGNLLFDVGLGDEKSVMSTNAARLGVDPAEADAVVISHLHLDHMGGIKAERAGSVSVPGARRTRPAAPCFVPAHAETPGFTKTVVTGPTPIKAIGVSTGPLARSLFFFGVTEEQAVVMRLAGKGLVVFTGCGHPTVRVILDMVRKISQEPIYAVGGGVHFPLKEGRGSPAGIQVQTIFGTGFPVWKRISDRELDEAIAAINGAGPKRVLLSAHDTDDYAIERLKRGLKAKTEVLSAGGRYRL